MADKKPNNTKHQVNIGMLGHIGGYRSDRPRLVELIMESIDQNGNIKKKDDANKQIYDNAHKGIEINKK